MAPRRYFRTTRKVQRSSNNAQPFFQPAPQEAERSSGSGFFAPVNIPAQAKLTVGQPGDKYEQEADQVADQVVSGTAHGDAPVVQRAEIKEEDKVQRAEIKEEEKIQRAEMKEEEKVQRAEMKEEEEKVQRAEMKEEDKVQRSGMKEEEEKVQRTSADCEKEEGVQRAEEKEEEKEATAIQASSAGGGMTVSAPVASRLQARKGQGSPLPASAQREMSGAFGQDFSAVRVHTGSEAESISQSLNAHAFTLGRDIYFNRGKFAPESREGKHLLAHELVHVGQQGSANLLQRRVEMRDVGRGEASGMARLPEIIDRLNSVSRGLIFSMDGNSLTYARREGGSLSAFDNLMIEFIDQSGTVPLRLTNQHGLMGNKTTGFHNQVAVDSFVTGYVDVDDLLASDNLGFQTALVHFVRERSATRNYERRIGTNFSQAEFDRGHAQGIEAEVQVLRDHFNDPTIRLISDSPSATVFRIFRNGRRDTIRTRGRRRRGVLGLYIEVRTTDGRTLTPEEYIQSLRAPESTE